MAHVWQTDILDHRQRAEARCVAGAVIGIHILEGQSSVGQRADGAFHMDLWGGEMGRFSHGMLKDPRYIRRAF